MHNWFANQESGSIRFLQYASICDKNIEKNIMFFSGNFIDDDASFYNKTKKLYYAHGDTLPIPEYRITIVTSAEYTECSFYSRIISRNKRILLFLQRTIEKVKIQKFLRTISNWNPQNMYLPIQQIQKKKTKNSYGALIILHLFIRFIMSFFSYRC